MRTFIAAAVLLAAAGASAFESQQGGFSAAFPAQPNIEDKATGRGSERWHKLIKDGHSFMVVYYAPAADVKALPLNQLIDAEEKGLVPEDSTVLRKRDFKLGAHPAREIDFKSKDGLVFMARVVVTPQRVFEIITATQGSSPSARQRAFIESFGVKAE